MEAATETEILLYVLDDFNEIYPALDKFERPWWSGASAYTEWRCSVGVEHPHVRGQRLAHCSPEADGVEGGLTSTSCAIRTHGRSQFTRIIQETPVHTHPGGPNETPHQMSPN